MHSSNFSYLVCISCKICIRRRFYLFLKTEYSRLVAESRLVCMGLNRKRNLTLTVVIAVGDLDGGKSLVELIRLMQHYMKANFLATLLVLGGLGIGIHYEKLNKKSDRGVLLIMAYGQPVSGKSTAVSIAMPMSINILGHKTSIGGTYRAVLNR